jgi:cell wall-associated NlpC family hydrolase
VAPRALPRPARRALSLAAAGLVALAVGALPATQAHATPSVTEVEAQIDQLWGTLEPLVEQYNGIHYQLTQNQAKQQALVKQMGPLQTQVDLAQVRVGAMSAQLYMRGPGSNLNALLESGSPAALMEELASLNELARQQQKTVAQVRQQVNQFATQKQALDLLVAQQQKQDADLAAKKNTIQAQLNQLEQLRTAAYGASGSVAGGVLKPVSCPYTYIGGAGGKAAQVACSLIGHPYGWGQAGPTYYDCSGLTMAAWAAAGVSLAHYTVTQRSQTRRISATELQPGDLVFYGSDLHHVALYVGGGWVVHAPKPGDKVRMAQMGQIGSINSYGRPG